MALAITFVVFANIVALMFTARRIGIAKTATLAGILMSSFVTIALLLPK